MEGCSLQDCAFPGVENAGIPLEFSGQGWAGTGQGDSKGQGHHPSTGTCPAQQRQNPGEQPQVELGGETRLAALKPTPSTKEQLRTLGKTRI